MYCKNCGKQISDDSIFCSSCGASQELTSVNAKGHEETLSNNDNSHRHNKFNIFFFFLFVILISMHIHYSVSYADYKSHYTVQDYNPLYQEVERFSNCGYILSSYEESSEVRELLASTNILRRHISTLGFQDNVIDYSYTYNYQCYISTYDISAMLPLFGGNEKIYEQCLSQLAQRTQAKEISLVNGGINAITWYGKGSVPTKYLGVCTNDRLYIIEAISEKNLDYRSNWLFSLFDFTLYPNSMYYLNSLLIMGCLIVICCIIFFVVNTRKYIKLAVINRYAFSLFVISVLSIVVNVIIAIVFSNQLHDICYETLPVIVMIGAETTALLSSLYLSVFYYRKSKSKWDKYYLVPSFLKKDFYNNMLSDKSKDSFVKWVCYPLMILSLLPCGFFVIVIYTIPLFIYITYKRWHNWACASQTCNQDD